MWGKSSFFRWLFIFHCSLSSLLTPEWSGGSMFHPLSHIYAKTPFCWIETVANNALNRRRVVFDWLKAITAPTLNAVYSLTNVHAKWWIHCLLISSTLLLPCATSIYDRSKRVCGVFWCFPGHMPNLGEQEQNFSYIGHKNRFWRE